MTLHPPAINPSQAEQTPDAPSAYPIKKPQAITMNPLHLAPAATLAKAARLTCVGLAALALCACSVLSPTATPPPAFYGNMQGPVRIPDAELR